MIDDISPQHNTVVPSFLQDYFCKQKCSIANHLYLPGPKSYRHPLIYFQICISKMNYAKKYDLIKLQTT